MDLWWDEPPVVLWGGHRGSVQLGAPDDRWREQRRDREWERFLALGRRLREAYFFLFSARA